MSNNGYIAVNGVNLSSFCDFTPTVGSLIEYKTGSSVENVSTELWVQIELDFGNDIKKDVDLPLSSIDKADWNKMDPRCNVSFKVKNASALIAGYIRSQLSDTSLPRKTQYVLKEIGLHNIDGKKIFLAGDRVFTRSSDTHSFGVKYGGKLFKLDIDDNFSPQEAFKGMTELISLVPGVGFLLLVYAIAGIIREAFIEAGLTPETILMVIGKSGMMKSSYIVQITQLYNRNSGVRADSRFDATLSFIEKYLSKYRNCTVTIDDIHTAASSKIKNRNETTAEEIVRQISDNIGRGHMVGNELVQDKFDGNAVFIGEYPIGSGSTTPRMLYVEFTERPDGKILHKYQCEKKLLMPTFYSYFIQWYVDNFEDIKKTIIDRLTKFRTASTMPQVHGRLADTLFYLQASALIMLEYCAESEFISEDEAIRLFEKFEIYVFQLINNQQHIYSQQSSVPADLNYLNIIMGMYNGSAFTLAKDVKRFDPDKHDGLIHYKCLCIRCDKLDAIMSLRLESYNRTKMINELKDKGALKLNNDGKNTIQIGSALKGKRFLAIYLDKLR